jgi:hypothetical protein
MPLELIPLATCAVKLAEPIVIGAGPAGQRVIFEVLEETLTGERLNATKDGVASADWMTIIDNVATIDVRSTFKTNDGALIYTTYRGRVNTTPGSAMIVYVAPLFETSDPRYAWLNSIQAVGKGAIEADGQLHYEFYELR